MVKKRQIQDNLTCQAEKFGVGNADRESLASAKYSSGSSEGGFFLLEKEEGLRYVLSGGCWPGKARGRLTRNGVSYVIWPSLLGYKLDTGTKIKKAAS